MTFQFNQCLMKEMKSDLLNLGKNTPLNQTQAVIDFRKRHIRMWYWRNLTSAQKTKQKKCVTATPSHFSPYCHRRMSFNKPVIKGQEVEDMITQPCHVNRQLYSPIVKQLK